MENAELKYSRDSNTKKAIRQFKELVNSTPDKQSSVRTDEREINLDDYPLVETVFKYDKIKDLSDNENRELHGVLDPPSSFVSESTTGDNGALQLQAYYLQDTIDQTREQVSEIYRKDDDKGLNIEENEI